MTTDSQPLSPEQRIAELTLRIGEELGKSQWLTIDHARIDDFAKTIDDHQWIHVDPVRADRVCSRFGANRVTATNGARLGEGRKAGLFPCQVPQQRMAQFAAQPAGTGPFLHGSSLLVAHLE